MLSYWLIGAVIAIVLLRGAFLRRRSNRLKSQHDRDDQTVENDTDMVTAVAEYECDEWRMVVGTADKLSQNEWDRTLQKLTNNIEDINREEGG